MTDPFVQRMMARTQARRNALGRLADKMEKENFPSLHERTQESTKASSSHAYERNYKSTNLDEAHMTEKNSRQVLLESNIPEEPLNIIQTSHPPPTSTVPSIKAADSNSYSDSTQKHRFQHLAERSKQLEQWEDDYSYHSTSGGTASNKEEAQGFTPSPSRSKLAYDFRDRSPLKDESRSRSPTKATICDSSVEPTRNVSAQPPKIVSLHSKTSVEKPSENRIYKPSLENRPQSPTKVQDLKNQWEEHIRNASPERQVRRVPSISPVRKQSQEHTSAVSRSRSPIKNASSASNICVGASYSTRHMSPSKSYQPLLPSQTPLESKPLSELNRGGLRASDRSSSPQKAHGQVVKADNVMPDIAPVIKNPLASVREKIAAFSSLTEHKEELKDPAELSVQDRKNLFEKNKGTFLIPKGPFGQCIPEKSLQQGSTKSQTNASIISASRSYEIPKPPKIASANKTFVCPENKPKLPQEEIDPAGSSVEAQRKHFEYLEDNWKANDINAKVMNERKGEMDRLLNRFRKVHRKEPNPQVVARDETSESEYPESETESSTSKESLQYNLEVPVGPPKPPRVAEYMSSPSKGEMAPPPPPMPNSPHSPFKRFNSTELDESCPRSPSKPYVPKIKPGCLFPSLSDIESHSDRVDSDEETKDSSFAESVLTCASMDSLGTHIQRVAQGTSAASSRQLATIKENPCIKRFNVSESMSASTLEALDAIDDALDEAFNDEDEPTPPKRSRDREDASSGVYKTPKIVHDSISSSDSSETSLAHSISMYRKQKPADVLVTPVRQIVRKPDLNSPKDSPISPSVTITARIRELQEEEAHQLTVISQASSAISVVAQHPEQRGTMQHIEAEKLLLVATQKRQAAVNEIQRLKAEGALGKRSYWSQDEDSSRGSISIANITLPLKQDFLTNAMRENCIHHFLVLVKHRDQVITSQLQTTPDCVVEGAITFPNLMALHNLTADFNISLEVYEFKVESLHSSGFKKEHSRLKLTPLKRLHKESKAYSSPAMSSPGGPYSVRSSSFNLVGFANLNINTLTRNAWKLENVPFNSPMTGHLLMRVSVTMEGGVTERSFLTSFDDVGGFGAWNRRWCVLNGPFLKYWNYPDDENKKECMENLDLRMCTTRKVEQVSRDVCARQFTFQLTFIKPVSPGDQNDLIHEIRDNTLITRVLLSADSKEERIVWCNKLNKALANIRAWDPDALRPEDFHV